MWADGAFWFETGAGTRKGHNLAADPRCTLSVAAHEFDLVVEGEAVRVDDPASSPTWRPLGGRGLASRGRRHRSRAHRPLQRPAAGPPPWHVYRLTPRTATAVATIDPGRATRWRF